jgi:outer membrane protein OmpA-like peptidoglycan-associated protein
MTVVSKRSGLLFVLATLVLPASGSAWGSMAAQQDTAPASTIVVTGERSLDPSTMTAGPDIKGVITGRSGDKIKVTTADGTSTIILISSATRIKASGGLFGTGGSKLGADSLLNGLPITVKTLQWTGGFVANQIGFKSSDLKTAMMIRNGTAQRFDEQTAATEALRGRMGDIDKYNIKSTTNVYFDTGQALLSARAKANLCATASAAEAIDNALMLVVGYTDSVGSDQFNQALSEKRAASVINYLQQACHWKPYRMLTPTGMAKADPLASNATPEGKAQNRRVAVNILVSKGLDGL